MPASRPSQPPLPWMPEQMERLPLATLVPFVRNSRTHSEAQVAQIAASIREFGWTNPVLIDGAGTIIAGHGRVLAARLLGLDAVPCVRLAHLTDAQRRAYVIADNKLALNAGWDDEALAVELQALNEEGFNLGVIGFDDEELADLGVGVPAPAEHGEPDELPAESTVVDSVLGTMYELGPHRLLCGDSTEKETWDTLLGSELADAVMTDPPYGVDYVGGTDDALPVYNDDAAGLPALLDAALGHALDRCKSGGAWYVAAPCGPNFLLFANWMNKHGILRQSLIWNKDTLVLGHGDYHYKHEFLFYGWKPGAPHHATPDRTQTSVWDVARPKRSADHPTMKPVEIYERMMNNSTDRGDIVLEPFGGSGTTLIAAARTGRICRACEIAPRYCDVIRRRWTKLARENNMDPGPGALE